MPFTLPDLPFAPDALEPFMSAETLDFHHGKHHQAYVDKTNELVAEAGLEGRSLVETIRAAKAQGHTSLFNNAAQLWNHSFFWQCLAPPRGQAPGGMLGEMIQESFGSLEKMLAALKEEATSHFASGWAWLVLHGPGLAITSLHDGDTPAAHEGMKPLFTLDVWEHAYYIDRRNDRGAYADAVLGNIVDWEFVASNIVGQGVSRADQPG